LIEMRIISVLLILVHLNNFVASFSVLPAISSVKTSSVKENTYTKVANQGTKVKNYQDDFTQDVLRSVFSMTTLVTIAFNVGMTPSNALDVDLPLASSSISSSISLSEEVKLLDMSLPSYGSISDPKAKQEAIKGVEPESDKKASSGIISSKKKAGGILASTSSSKSKPPKKEKPKVAVDNDDVQEKKEQSKIATVDMSMPSYSDNVTAKEKSVFAL